jgi:hypothetical protein
MDDINTTYKSYYNIILVLPQILAYLNSLQYITYMFYLDSSVPVRFPFLHIYRIIVFYISQINYFIIYILIGKY